MIIAQFQFFLYDFAHHPPSFYFPHIAQAILMVQSFNISHWIEKKNLNKAIFFRNLNCFSTVSEDTVFQRFFNSWKLNAPLWNDFAEPVFDGVGLAGFKSQGQCFFIGINCYISTIFFYYFSLSLHFVYWLVSWCWGLLADRVYITLSQPAPPTSFNNNSKTMKSHIFSWNPYTEWPYRQGGCLICWRLQGQLPSQAAPIYTLHEEIGGTAHEGGVKSKSIGCTISDAIVRSWLWSTASRSCPLGYFSRLLQVIFPLWFWGIRIQPTFALVRVVKGD